MERDPKIDTLLLNAALNFNEAVRVINAHQPNLAPEQVLQVKVAVAYAEEQLQSALMLCAE